MKRVFLFSVLLVGGLVVSQLLPGALGEAYASVSVLIRLLTMLCLSFIMIHVGYEFEIDRGRPLSYAVDYGVAATAAAFPWIFCALYFIVVIALAGPPGALTSGRTRSLRLGSRRRHRRAFCFPCSRLPGFPPPGFFARRACSQSSTTSTPFC